MGWFHTFIGVLAVVFDLPLLLQSLLGLSLALLLYLPLQEGLVLGAHFLPSSSRFFSFFFGIRVSQLRFESRNFFLKLT